MSDDFVMGEAFAWDESGELLTPVEDTGAAPYLGPVPAALAELEVPPVDPVAEMRAEIEALRAELAALQAPE